MASSAGKGATLVNAFSEGTQRLLELYLANFVFLLDKSVYLNVLTGSVKSDTSSSGADKRHGRELLDGLEYPGMIPNLPAQAVMKAVGSVA